MIYRPSSKRIDMARISWGSIKEFIPLATFVMTSVGFAITWHQFNQEISTNQKSDYELVHEHKQRINNLLLQKPEVAKRMGLSENILIGFILVNDLEKLYGLRCKGLISHEQWQQVESMIFSQLSLNSYFRKDFWDLPIPGSPLNGRANRPSQDIQRYSSNFSHSFQKYISNLTDGTKPRKNEEKNFCGSPYV